MGKWIPCSERLPENPNSFWEEKEYLVCEKGGLIAVFRWADGWNCFISTDGTYINKSYEITDVVAWMPLPEPYKGGSK